MVLLDECYADSAVVAAPRRHGVPQRAGADRLQERFRTGTDPGWAVEEIYNGVDVSAEHLPSLTGHGEPAVVVALPSAASPPEGTAVVRRG